MTWFYLALDDALVTARYRDGRWEVGVQLEGMPVQCVAGDPLRPERVYAGTFGQGLWRSQDGGATWEPVGAGISYAEVMSVAVSALERAGDHGVLWAGTEPSALFRSEDGGRTWEERPTLRMLPSAPTWRFPPRPWTHHVRWIEPDPVVAGRLFVGIELGGVMRSLDGGLTWEDRKPGSQHDAHTLRTHPLAPGRVYETAGGGYAESRDGGANWQGDDAGRRHHYLWGLAVDPGNPETVVVSAAYGPRQAHDRASAESTFYRKSGPGAWQEVRAGLPEAKGTRAAILATNAAEPVVFYTATDGTLYHSVDAAFTWERMDLPWPSGHRQSRVQGLVVVEDG